VKIWSPYTGELIRNLNGHTQGLSDIAWSSDSVYLASASDDTTIRIWEVDSVRLSDDRLAPFRSNSIHVIYVGPDAETAQGAHKVGLLPQLQHRVQSPRLGRLRWRYTDMEHRERYAHSYLALTQIQIYHRKMHEDPARAFRFCHGSQFQQRRHPNRVVFLGRSDVRPSLIAHPPAHPLSAPVASGTHPTGNASKHSLKAIPPSGLPPTPLATDFT
jgi:hypothetical protein